MYTIKCSADQCLESVEAIEPLAAGATWLCHWHNEWYEHNQRPTEQYNITGHHVDFNSVSPLNTLLPACYICHNRGCSIENHSNFERTLKAYCLDTVKMKSQEERIAWDAKQDKLFNSPILVNHSWQRKPSSSKSF